MIVGIKINDMTTAKQNKYFMTSKLRLIVASKTELMESIHGKLQNPCGGPPAPRRQFVIEHHGPGIMESTAVDMMYVVDSIKRTDIGRGKYQTVS